MAQEGGRVPRDTLPHRLMLVRNELGWSQREAATKCGITFGEWQSMEMGRKARGLDEKVWRIAQATGYSAQWLMWGGPLGPTEYGESRSSNRCIVPALALTA